MIEILWKYHSICCIQICLSPWGSVYCLALRNVYSASSILFSDYYFMPSLVRARLRGKATFHTFFVATPYS